MFGPDIVIEVFSDGGSTSPSCKCKQILVLVQKKKKKITKGSRRVASRALAPVVTFPCSCPSGGVVTWKSVVVWVVSFYQGCSSMPASDASTILTSSYHF